MLSSNYTPCFCRKTKPNPPQSWHWRHNSDRGNATFWTQTRKRAVSSDSSFIFSCNLKSFFFSKIRLKFTKFVTLLNYADNFHPLRNFLLIWFEFGTDRTKSCVRQVLLMSSWTWLKKKRMFAVCQRDGGFLLCMTSVYIEWAKITSIKCWDDSPLLLPVF